MSLEAKCIIHDPAYTVLAGLRTWTLSVGAVVSRMMYIAVVLAILAQLSVAKNVTSAKRAMHSTFSSAVTNSNSVRVQLQTPTQ